MKPITVVIPNYNGAHLLKKNLGSVILFASGCKVIVVDDGSNDDSADVVRQDFPSVELVLHHHNKGFSEAIRSGVDAAKTEFVFFLNSDVELVEDIFTPLLKYFEDKTIFSVCPLMKNELGHVSKHSWNRRHIVRGRLKLYPWTLESALSCRKDNKLFTLYSSGGSMLVRKSMFNELNGFDSIFKPFYVEDFDLGLRAWRRGWGSYFEPGVHVVHQDKGSIEESEKEKRVKAIKRRNRYFLEWIHFSSPRLIFSTLPISLFQIVGELLTFDRVNIKGFVMSLARLPEVYRARRAVKKYEELPLQEIISRVENNDV